MIEGEVEQGQTFSSPCVSMQIQSHLNIEKCVAAEKRISS